MCRMLQNGEIAGIMWEYPFAAFYLYQELVSVFDWRQTKAVNRWYVIAMWNLDKKDLHFAGYMLQLCYKIIKR